MIAKVTTGSVIGIDGALIDVEIDIAKRGLPTFTIVGLPSKSVDEAKERVKSALHNSGFSMPENRLTVNLAPADIPKEGSHFDLPIALGILTAQTIIEQKSINNTLCIGELSLEGNVRKVQGAVAMVLGAIQKGIHTVILPKENALEVAILQDITVIPAERLSDIVLHLTKRQLLPPLTMSSKPAIEEFEFDFVDIKGQEAAKRALTIVAAGMHNIHICGTPGSGKTMMARMLPSILPTLTRDEQIEVTKIYSVAGLLKDVPIITVRPMRNPHHTTSRNGLIGGGTKPTPGEITLAHRGVLFLDEFPEFPHGHLEALRQPLEDGMVTISRASGSLTFPAKFVLFAASNPCPCGYLGHPKKPCVCSQQQIQKYTKRISGPIQDRIDLHVYVQPVDEEKLLSTTQSKTSRDIREIILKAQLKQSTRFAKVSIHYNSEMKSTHIKEYVKWGEGTKELLKKAITTFNLSARSYTKVVKVAQTIADIDGDECISVKGLSEALQYRPRE